MSHHIPWLQAEIKRARDPRGRGRKLQNNTYLRQLEDGSLVVRLHATDIVTVTPDGDFILRSGGYHTNTTRDRITSYSPMTWRTLLSEHGDWYVRLTPDPSDPRPEVVHRSVCKPYTADNPGDEPVKSSAGCIAGDLLAVPHVNEKLHIFRKDMQAGDVIVYDNAVENGREPDKYDFIDIERSWVSHVYYGESAQCYQDDGWGMLDDNSNPHRSSFVNDDGETVQYEQCAHCAAFDLVHEQWRYAMHGGRWERRYDRWRGYALYAANLNLHGSMEAWQAAYIEDFRARRAYLKAEREWDERNRVPFYEGIVVDSDGYAQREGGPSKAKLDRHKREVARIRRAVNRFIDGYVKELRKGTMPMPSGADCWYCSLRTESGQPMGDNAQTLHSDGTVTREVNTDHLWSHIEEGYYVPSLAVNALRERGYKDVGIYFWLDMDQEAGTMGKASSDYKGLRRDLRKYMLKRLLPTAPTA